MTIQAIEEDGAFPYMEDNATACSVEIKNSDFRKIAWLDSLANVLCAPAMGYRCNPGIDTASVKKQQG
jgi:hypothetical protein